MRNAARTAGWLLPVLAAAVLLTGGTPPARADEHENRLETRLFQVGALVMGKSWFIGETPPPVLPSDVADQEDPIFGAEAEEPFYPLGMVDELIELCKGAVQPLVWESVEGADLRSMGCAMLVARAPKRVLDELGVFLARRESEVLRSMRVDVQAVPLEGGAPWPTDPADVEARLAGPDAGPALSFVAWSGQRVSAVNGRQLAYVADYDVSVAQESAASDPLIGVANLGLMADVRLTPTGSDATLVDAWIRLAEVGALRAVDTGEHRSVDAPTFETAEAHALVEAAPGRWTHAGGGSHWAFYVRVTPAAYEARPARLARLPETKRTGGVYELRYYDVSDLAHWTTSYVPTEPGHLWPSRFTPPEPPELGEPGRILPAEWLIEIIREQGGGDTWEDPAAAEARNGVLILRNEPSVHAATEELLAVLRREFLWSLTTTVEVLEMPAALARQLEAATDPTLVLNAAGGGLLAAAREEGHAHRVAGASVVNRQLARNAVQVGRSALYLQDYAVEIAQGAAISDPVIKTFFSGLQVDLACDLTCGGDAVALEVRFLQTDHGEAMRKLATPAGPVELPELDVFRVRTSLVVPLGRTILLASRGEGDRRRVLLLTPSLQRTR